MKVRAECLAFGRAARRILQLRKTNDVTPGAKSVAIRARGRGLEMATVNADGGAHELVDAVVEEEGELIVGMDMFDKLISCTPQNGSVRLEADGKQMTAASGRVRQRLPVSDAGMFQWPEMPSPEKPRFTIRDQALQDVIRSVIWATKDDPGRLQCWSVHMTNEASEATDTVVLARMTPGIMPPGTEIFVPADAWPRIRAFVDGRHESMTAVVDDTLLWIDGGSWKLFQRLMPPMNYFGGLIGQLVYDPDDSGVHYQTLGGGREEKLRVFSVLVNRDELLTSCRHVQTASEVVSGERRMDGGVRFMMKPDNSLSVVSHYPADSLVGMEVDEEIRWSEDAVTTNDTSPFSILSSVCFSSLYLVKALTAMNGDVVKMLWASSLSGAQHPPPLQFHDQDGRVKTMVGPRRL